MDLAAKLQLKAGHRLTCVRLPDSVASALTGFTGDGDGDGTPDAALLAFVADRSSLEAHRAQIVASAGADRLTWVAYPKAGQLGTDLHRDSLAEFLTASGLQPVRQIAIDPVWSALRFRPA